MSKRKSPPLKAGEIGWFFLTAALVAKAWIIRLFKRGK